MEKRFKLRISSMLKSSLGSCRSKSINDVTEKKPDFFPQNRKHHQLMELFSPKARPFCRPKWPLNSHIEPSYKAHKNTSPRSKISDLDTLLVPADNGKKSPSASPFLPLNSYYELEERKTKPKQRKHGKASAKNLRFRKKIREFNDFPGCNFNGLFSSDEENEQDDDDDKTTFFSSRSLSSDSSGSFRRNNAHDGKHKSSNKAYRRRRAAYKKEPGEEGVQKMRLVKGSFAMVKSSSDPYNDFRASMVEMIVEKKIFAAEDLENMLQCFLSLNSYHHHRVIIQAFTEIWGSLFSNWS